MSDALLFYWGALVGAVVSLAVVLAARLKEWGAAVMAGVGALEFCGVAAFLGWMMWR
jgi:hypothetical protein